MAYSYAHSCNSADETLAWITAIVDFLRPFTHLLQANVVNFFKDRLWESIDEQWMDCLRKESLECLIQIPSGFVQSNWPTALKEFICTLRSLVLPQDPHKLRSMLPDLHVVSLGSVVSQGMNMKKKHEVEVLAAVISAIANKSGVQTIIDVGSGQGYLAQVLSFEHQHSVLAIDASSHHGSVTSGRAERIKKHYASKIRKSQNEKKQLKSPETVTCNLLSSATLKAVISALSNKEKDEMVGFPKDAKDVPCSTTNFDGHVACKGSLMLAGLHACGDLSVTMLRTFLECEEVKAVISIGCCYNLLSEDCLSRNDMQCGFPISNGCASLKLMLGRNSRDLACQSAERWRNYPRNVTLQNFEVHAFRAALQMVLCEYYPDIVHTSPSIGRQGKSFRRQLLRKSLYSELLTGENSGMLLDNEKQCQKNEFQSTPSPSVEVSEDTEIEGASREGILENEKSCAFERFCKSGLARLGLELSHETNVLRIWQEALPFCDLIGPYWSLRAALGPLVETLILLDRLLFLQEQGDVIEATIVPLFNPILSPRNMAIIGRKVACTKASLDNV